MARKYSFKETAIVWALAIYELVMGGVTFSVLWSWFIADLFGLRGISIAEASGLYLVSSFFHKLQKTEQYTNLEHFIITTVKPVVYLSFGWLVHLFI